MRRQDKDWGPGIIPLAIAIAIALLVLLGAPKIMGADKSDSTWVEIKPPQEESRGQAVRMVCPICGQCYPKEIQRATTLMGCLSPPYCCNTSEITFSCQAHKYKDSTFTVKIGECDWIKWGRKVAKGDMDSLVDKSDWTIKKKKK